MLLTLGVRSVTLYGAVDYLDSAAVAAFYKHDGPTTSARGTPLSHHCGNRNEHGGGA